MGRRKKEPADVHRASIASAAEQLFMKKGIEAATMEDIAREAGYSKATLYVYFKNKEEIAGVLILEGMKKLCGYISQGLEAHGGTRERYDGICNSLLQYQEEFPFYFHMVLREINVDYEKPDVPSVYGEIYRMGEKINDLLMQFIKEGMESGEIRPDIEPKPTVISFWAMLSGLVQMAVYKERYIEKGLGITNGEFLRYGFHTLYQSLSLKEGTV